MDEDRSQVFRQVKIYAFDEHFFQSMQVLNFLEYKVRFLQLFSFGNREEYFSGIH